MKRFSLSPKIEVITPLSDLSQAILGDIQYGLSLGDTSKEDIQNLIASLHQLLLQQESVHTEVLEKSA